MTEQELLTALQKAIVRLAKIEMRRWDDDPPQTASEVAGLLRSVCNDLGVPYDLVFNVPGQVPVVHQLDLAEYL